MPDLSINFLGEKLKNPIIAASGTFAFGDYFDEYFDIQKLGGISLKALTKDMRDGNDTPRIAETSSGIINSVGLQNPGVDTFLSHIYPKIKDLRTCLIANVSGSTFDEYMYVLDKLNQTDVKIMELNISCPNVKKGGLQFGADEEAAYNITKKAKEVTDKKLMVKLTPNVTDIASIAKAVESAGADAVSLVNTFTAMAIDIRKRKPILANRIGGLSGPAIKPIAVRMVNQVYNAVDIPVCGMGGIMSGEDVAEFMIAGATCVMVGTGNMVTPDICVKIKKELKSFLKSEKIKNVSELTGSLL